jgi:hypothetical protein
MAGGGGEGGGVGAGGALDPPEPPPQEASRAKTDNRGSDKEVLFMGAIRQWLRGQPSVAALRTEVVN